MALKNGYALGIALTIGVNKRKFANDTLHFNSQAGVFYQAAREMKALLSLQGAPDFENLAVGLGDLYTVIYDTSDTDNPSIDLFVTSTTPSFSSKEIEDLPIYYQVYSAKITINDVENYNLADLSYVATDLVGSINIENGKPMFVPYKK